MPLTQVSSRLIEDTLRYVLGASGTNHYTFTGKGLTGAVNDPTLTLSRGHTYVFENRNSANAHPFYIKTSIANGGTNDAYNTGVTNNGGAGGTEIVFTVPHDAPDVLYYQCSSHINMAGQLNIAGSVADGSITTAKLADSSVTTAKIAGGAVNTSELAEGAVTNTKLGATSVSTAKIVDDAVTEDKLANSINSAIAANTAKDLTALSASNLTSGTVPDARFPATLPAISGANLTGISSDFVKISSTTMSGEASEFDLTFDNSTYSQFKLYICGLNLSYDANLYVRFRVGTTFITASNYYGGTIKKYASGFDSNTYGGQHQSYGYLSDNVGGNDATYERWSGIIDILCGNNAGMPFLRHDSFYKSAASNHVNTMGIVGYQNWSILSGIRVYASSGNINHGKFELYGVK